MRHLRVGTVVFFVFFAVMVAGAGSVAGDQTAGQLGSSAVGDAAAQTDDPNVNTIRLRANGSITSYSFEARNLVPLEKTDLDRTDSIVDERASGTVGEGGIDKYQYTGSIYNFNTEDASAISVWINGEPVDPENVGREGRLPKQSSSTATPRPEPTETQPSTTQDVASNYNLSKPDFGKQPISVGREIKVTAVVTNTGDQRFTTTFGLSTQGEVVDSQEVSLFPGSSQQISFEYTYESPGEYAMRIGSLNESGAMTQVGLTDPMVVVTAEGQLTEVQGQVGGTTTASASDIPTLASNQTTTGTAFVMEQTGNLTVTNLTVVGESPPFRPGNLVSFEASISNPTSQQLNGSFTFAINNGTISQQTITVPAGETQSLIFTHRFAEARNYTVSVGDQTRAINVQPPQTTVANATNGSAMATNDSSQRSSGGSGGIISTITSSLFLIILMALLIIVGLAGVFFGWLQTSAEKENINR
jgi:hypothetical protein